MAFTSQELTYIKKKCIVSEALFKRCVKVKVLCRANKLIHTATRGQNSLKSMKHRKANYSRNQAINYCVRIQFLDNNRRRETKQFWIKDERWIQKALKMTGHNTKSLLKFNSKTNFAARDERLQLLFHLFCSEPCSGCFGHSRSHRSLDEMRCMDG